MGGLIARPGSVTFVLGFSFTFWDVIATALMGWVDILLIGGFFCIYVLGSDVYVV